MSLQPPERRLVTEATLADYIGENPDVAHEVADAVAGRDLVEQPPGGATGQAIVKGASGVAWGDVTVGVGVSSDSVARIVTVAEGDPIPPMMDGDLLVTYKLPGENHVFTFAGDTVGQPPAGWTALWGQYATWEVVNLTGATGGKALRMYQPHGGQRDLLVRDDITETDVEVLMRWRSTEFTGSTPQNLLSLVARARGGTGNETGWRGGARHSGGYSIYQMLNGTVTLRNDGSFTFAINTWYMTRLRVQGDQLSVKVWKDGDPEPTTGQISTHDTIPGAGKAGIYSGGQFERHVDWVAIATQGRTAQGPS